jgi:4-amino-4-deoxy-L-arabinose transferase-like glycosyltransferase
MIEALHHRRWHYALLIIIAGPVFFLNLGGPTLWDVDEGRNSTCALEMMQADNWIVPTFNGQLRTDKPVLLYWLQILAIRAFGIGEYAVRLPSALAAFITVLVIYELARSMFGRTTGLLAAVILATTPMQCGAAHFANPDSLLNCFTVMTVAIFWFGLGVRGWWWFGLLGVSSGFAVLAKGPVGLILPTAVMSLYLLWQRQLAVLWDRRWFAGFCAFVITALPWYIWVGIETKGEFLAGFLLKHNLERGVSPMGAHAGFPGYYLVVIFIGTMPWSIFLIASWWFGLWSAIRCPWSFAKSVWSRTAEVGTSDSQKRIIDLPAAYRLLACWTLVYLVFFSVAATKLPNYVLPVAAPTALFIARFLRRWTNSTLTVPTWAALGGMAGLFLIGIGMVVGLTAAGGVGELAVFRGRFLPGLETWAPLGLIPIVAASAGCWFIRRGQFSRVVVAVATAAVVLITPALAFTTTVLNQYKVPQSLTQEIGLCDRKRDFRIGVFQMDQIPSLNFYARRDIDYLEYKENLIPFLQYRTPVFVFIAEQDWQQLGPAVPVPTRVVARHYDLYSHRDILVVTNQ